MRARFPGTCPKCRRPIAVGDDIQAHRGPSTRRWEHTTCPEPQHLDHVVTPAQLDFARRYGVDDRFVQYVAELVDESGGNEREAWLINCQNNEHWDGEVEFQEAAWEKWTAAMPLARAQNALLRRHNRPAETVPVGPGRNIGRREAFRRYGSHCD